MINKYTIGQKPVEFLVKLKIADNKHNPEPLDLTGYTALQIEIRKPDGTVFTKPALPKDTAKLTDTYIRYLNNESTGSILDQAGEWSYTGIVIKNGTEIKGVNREVFWVMP